MIARIADALSKLGTRGAGVVAEVRQPSGSVSFIGMFNTQHCFPATQRNYVISAIAAHREQGDAQDLFETPTSDAVRVRINVDNAQNLTKVQEEIATTLAGDLDSTLGGRYFEDVQFRLVQVRFDELVQKSITAATAMRADDATKRLQAQQLVETATGEWRAAQQKAQGIRATRKAYHETPAQARIDAIRALPSGIKALGGNVNTIVGGEP